MVLYFSASPQDPDLSAEEIATQLIKDIHNRQQYSKARTLLKHIQTIDKDADLYPKTPEIEQDIDIVIQKWRAAHELEDGLNALNEDRFETALRRFTIAQRLDPDIDITARQWESLCWRIMTDGIADSWDELKTVISIAWFEINRIQQHLTDKEIPVFLGACDAAVNRNPNHGGYRDSRSLARALTGDTTGAIEDFQAYIDWSGSPPRRKRQRQEWIEALEAGDNPFTDDLLKQLREE
ncbi:MAG: hypothetical protein MJA27_04290 [Pseudanabaenales cyanobacterium]|nr:hypothetical protein [Pseudanabaenales cyanobacterium]